MMSHFTSGWKGAGGEGLPVRKRAGAGGERLAGKTTGGLPGAGFGSAGTPPGKILTDVYFFASLPVSAAAWGSSSG